MIVFTYIPEDQYRNAVEISKEGDDFYFDELVEMLEKFGLAMGFVQGTLDCSLSYDEDTAYRNKGE